MLFFGFAIFWLPTVIQWFLIFKSLVLLKHFLGFNILINLLIEKFLGVSNSLGTYKQ